MISDKIILAAAKQFGTPLYLYDGNQIKSSFHQLRKLAPIEFDIFYSMKANPLLGICQLLQNENAACEVCSEAELIIALKAGFKPQNIIFVGPGKSNKELELCLKHKIYAIACESLDELYRLNKIAKEQQAISPVLLRLNPDFYIEKSPLKMGGKSTQFGIDVAIAKQEINQILSYSNIKIMGIHIYNGTRILDADGIINNTINILNLAETLTNEWSLKFECIDIGGGLGIPYFENEKELNIEKLFAELMQPIKHYLSKHPRTRFILETGRYLVGKSGLFINKIIALKTSHHEKFIITNGGMNCHMAATGMGSFIRRNFSIDLVSTLKKNDITHSYQITGPLCTPGDVLANQVILPEAALGDLIVIRNSGAYGPTASPGRFLSHGFPAEVLFENKKFHLLKRRETSEDILLAQNSLPFLLTKP